MSAAPRVLPDVIAEHASEAGFLWKRRRRMVDDPMVDTAALAEHDARIDAHLNGVRLAGAAGLAIVRNAFTAEPKPPEAFTLIASALRADDTAQAIDLLRGAEPAACWLAAAAAAAWAPWARVAPLALRAAADDDVRLRSLALRAIAAHRVTDHPALARDDADAGAARADALVACGRADLAPTLRPLLHADDIPLRFQAARALWLLCGDAAALGVLAGCADSTTPLRLAAADLLARRGEAVSVRTWIATGSSPERVRIAGAAALGDPDLLPWLLNRLGEPLHARAAADAIATITGCAVPEGHGGGEASDEDDLLPWPDAERLRQQMRRTGADHRHPAPRRRTDHRRALPSCARARSST